LSSHIFRDADKANKVSAPEAAVAVKIANTATIYTILCDNAKTDTETP